VGCDKFSGDLGVFTLLAKLGIPVVKDRILQTVLKFVLELICEREPLKMSYGSRPGLGCKDVLLEVEGAYEGRPHFCGGCRSEKLYSWTPFLTRVFWSAPRRS
jgi:hypothetical protein